MLIFDCCACCKSFTLYLIAFCEQQALCRGQATKLWLPHSSSSFKCATHASGHLRLRVIATWSSKSLCKLHLSNMCCACCTYQPCTLCCLYLLCTVRVAHMEHALVYHSSMLHGHGICFGMRGMSVARGAMASSLLPQHSFCNSTEGAVATGVIWFRDCGQEGPPAGLATHACTGVPLTAHQDTS